MKTNFTGSDILTDAIELMWMLFPMVKDIVIGGILQHIEQAGIHSGDSACSCHLIVSQ